MVMTSVEIKVPEKARQYVLNSTTEKCVMLYCFSGRQSINFKGR